MENSETLIFLACTCFVISLLFIFSRAIDFKPKSTPPGPKPWPIIGNLDLIGPVPHRSLHRLAKKYGGLMYLKFGKFPVLVVSSPEMAKEFLKKHDANFASRPALAAGKYTTYDYSGISWSPYGPHLTNVRKICQNQLLSEKAIDSYKHLRVEEMGFFLSRLHAVSGSPVVLRQHLSRYTISIMIRTVMGDEYMIREDSAEILQEIGACLKEWFILNGAVNLGDWVPFLSLFDLQGHVKKMKLFKERVDRFLNQVLKDHTNRRRGSSSSWLSKDFVDLLLDLSEDPNTEFKLTKDSIKSIILELMAAGTDSTTTTVEWAVHEILRHPRTMKRAKEELNKIVGANRWVEEDDFSELPYLNAILMESMRLHPIATLLGPHYSMEDCNVAGYDIVKGTTVMFNTWSIGRDPRIWEEPESFMPERFLGKDIDLTGQDFSMLPFSSGRRMCPGYRLALVAVRSMLANLLHGFDLKLMEGMKPEDVSIEELYGLSTHPKNSISIVIEPTLESHLYLPKREESFPLQVENEENEKR